MPGVLTAFRAQLIDQRFAALYILSSAALRPLDAALLGRDAQFVVFNPQNDLISNLDAKRLAEGGGDYDAPVLIHARPGFLNHGTLRPE
jgi:hypothetical protein